MDCWINWNVVTAVGTFGSFIVILVGAIVAGIQLYELRRSRNLATLLAEFERLNSRESREARRTVYALDAGSEAGSGSAMPSLLAGAELEAAEFVGNQLNNVGFLVANKFIPEEPSLELFATLTIRCWYKLRHFIRGRRRKAGVYMHHFQWLAWKCLQYSQAKHPAVPLLIFSAKAAETVKLSRAELQEDILSDLGRYEIGAEGGG